MSDYMKFETESASADEKKKNRAKNIQAAREANAKIQRQEAMLTNLTNIYRDRYPDEFRRRYPRGIATNRRIDKDKLISRLKAELSELDQDSSERRRKAGTVALISDDDEKPIAEGERAIQKVDSAVNKKTGFAALSEAVKTAFRAGVNYLTGGQGWIADIALDAISALWENRKKVAAAWRKMKEWFTGVKKRKLSIEDVKGRITTLAVAPNKTVPEFNKTFLNIDLRKNVIDLLKSKSEVAKILFDNPTQENLVSLLQKYSGNPLPPGTAEACQALLTKDNEIRNILNEANEASKQIEAATTNFKESIDRGDLVSANGALTPVASGGIKNDGPSEAPGPVVVQGFTDEMIKGSEQYKRLLEEFMKSRNQVSETLAAAERLKQEQRAIVAEFERRANEAINRRVEETKEMYEGRLANQQAILDSKNKEYTQTSESLALTQATLRTAEADRDGYQKQFIEATKRNEQLVLDIQALATKGSEQSSVITGLNETIERYKNQASLFQSVTDDYDNKLIEATNQKESELAALKEENRLVVADKERRIIELNDKIKELTEQVNTQKDLVDQGKKLLDDRAKEIVSLQAKGDTSNALINTYQDERRQLAAERDRLEQSNAALENKIVAFRQESTALTTENDNYRSKIKQLEAQVDAGREAQGKIANVNAGLKNRIEQLKNIAKKHEAENVDLQNQIAELVTLDSKNKEALLKLSQENILLKTEKQEILEGTGAKYRMLDEDYQKLVRQSKASDTREADLRGQIEAANRKIKQLSDEQEQYRKQLERHKTWFRGIFQKDKQAALEKNLVTVEAQRVAAAVSADEARDNLWQAIRGDYRNITKRVAGSTGGAYLVGKAPDWNLQPNERIKQFWSKFYDLSFHPY